IYQSPLIGRSPSMAMANMNWNLDRCRWMLFAIGFATLPLTSVQAQQDSGGGRDSQTSTSTPEYAQQTVHAASANISTDRPSAAKEAASAETGVRSLKWLRHIGNPDGYIDLIGGLVKNSYWQKELTLTAAQSSAIMKLDAIVLDANDTDF